MRTGLSVADALRIVLETTPRTGLENVATQDALGRVLGEPVVSSRTIPPADNSAMDGFAVRAADVVGAGPDSPVELRIALEVPAGAVAAGAIGPGEAARIFTGAPVPAGADCVVRQEDAAWEGERAREGERVRVLAPASPGENVRCAGEDVKVGDRVLAPGDRVGPAEIGMLAALGRSVVAVHQRPRVALLSGGDELVEPDGDVAGGRIVSSNSYSLAAQCREAGAEPVYLGIARDTPEDLERRLRAGLRADAIVSSAGVSVGDRDHVRAVLEKLGCSLAFWGVLMKPGYPLVFGRLPDGPLVFGLPGNPVSAMMTFEQFVRPALLAMAGHRALHRPLVEATLTHPLRKPAGRLHFVRVQLSRRDGAVLAASTGSQSSGVLRSMTLANGVLLFPAEATELAAGARVRVQVLDARFLAAPDPGV